MRALVLLATIASLLVTSATFAPAEATAQETNGTESLEVWGISSGIVTNPKTWKFRQSDTVENALGSAEAADPDLDDSAWGTQELRWRDFPGPDVGNHFRKQFDLNDLDVELYQVVGMQVSIQYDDSAILYLNGHEVYRSIRGNLDPTYSEYPISANVPFDVKVPFGGAEELYIGIPNVNKSNTCEKTGPLCPTSPFGGPDTPEIDPSLLVDGVNTWAVTTWNQIGGSGDSSLNHTFELLIDEAVVAPNAIFINEVVASNNGSYSVQLDADDKLETPDWFELVNISDEDVNLGGWTISDATASWVFPGTAVVPANGYLVVAANDGDDATSNPLQTNFKLSTSGDALKLTNPSGIVADDYGVIPQQFADNSFGRPNDDVTAEPTYLDVATPYLDKTTPNPASGTNSAEGDGYAPILRPFASRLYNRGEAVAHQVDAFDPDGDALVFSMTPSPPGITMDAGGAITGTAIADGTFETTITVTDSDNDSASQLVQWFVLPPASGPSPLVLNEYNAVADDREMLSGGVVGNGGDWFEFVVVEDNLDLRGYTVDLYDRKGADDQLRFAASVTFANDVRLSNAPAGTIVTISEDFPTDLNFGGVDDWHINLQVDTPDVNGDVFAVARAGSVFNSTRSGQVVVIRDASGALVTPATGETEAWDEAAGGVSGGEVMNLCVSPSPGYTPDPLLDYRDNPGPSSFGEPNTCQYLDPQSPLNTVVFSQDLNSLRSTATFDAGNGDTNCDGVLNVFDSVNVSQFFVGLRTDSGPCFFDQGGPGFDMYAGGGDANNDGITNTFDAVLISQCVANVQNALCPSK